MGFLDNFFGGAVSNIGPVASGNDYADLLGTGGGGSSTIGSFLSDIAPYATMAGLSYLNTYNQGQAAKDQLASQQQFSSSEAEKERQFQLQLLREKLAAGGGGGGGGGAAAALAKKKMLLDSYAKAQDTLLAGGQLPMQSLRDMISAVQNGLAMVR